MMKPMTTDLMVAIGRLALKFGLVNRATFHADGETPESDTDHTVMLGLIACETAARLGWSVGNIGRVAQFALVHDLVEAYAGDTNSFDLTARQAGAKHAREAKAMKRLREEFGDDSWMIQMIDQYEAQERREARLVRYLDKAMPKITDVFNQCAAKRAMGVTLADVITAHADQYVALREEYPDVHGSDGVGILLARIMVKAEDSWPKESV